MSDKLEYYRRELGRLKEINRELMDASAKVCYKESLIGHKCQIGPCGLCSALQTLRQVIINHKAKGKKNETT